MKKFALKFALFLLPIAIFLSVSVVIFYHTYEAHHSIKKVIKDNDHYIIGYNYSEHNYHFLKFQNINDFPEREILALGTSRVLQFREKMFIKSFYNAGYTVHSITNYIYFLKLIPKDKYPKYLFMNIDQFFFNKPMDNSIFKSISKIPHSYTRDEKRMSVFSAYLQLYPDIIFNLGNLRKILSSKGKNEYGIKAILTESGYRNDGSFAYNYVINKQLKNDSTVNDYHFNLALKRMNDTSDNIYGKGDTLNSYAVIILDTFLKFCSTNNIKVIGFLPPFANCVYSKMLESGKYHYLDSLESKIGNVFSKYNFELYNYIDLTKINAGDSEMLDGMHPSEVIDEKILLSILSKKSVLNEVCDSNQLKSDLNHKINRYTVYDY